MLIIIEPDLKIRKKLCDLLTKERIIGVDTIPDAIEKICYFRREIDLVIAHINFFVEIVNKKIIDKICAKLYIKNIPLAGYFLKGEGDILGKLPGDISKLPIIEYDETDENFPFRFIRLLKDLYPRLNYEIEKVKENWLKKKIEKQESLVDIRKWLLEEGFIGGIEKKEEKKEITLEQALTELNVLLKELEVKPKSTEEIDYKKLYFEMKEKYEQLLKYVEELRKLVGDSAAEKQIK
ncbi:MAG: hypothetical protein ABIL70_01950 [candidate division WOR-3 bacterium]